MEWQPIETAPKDVGVEFLVWRDGWFFPAVASYDEVYDLFYCPTSGEEYFNKPTHWMLLPEPPK